MIKNLRPFVLIAILLSTFFTSGYAASSCKSLFSPNAKIAAPFDLSQRLKIIESTHYQATNKLLQHLQENKTLIFKGDHKYEPGNEFLASNEFDWAKTPDDYEKTDLVIGFGTNSVWDIALRKKAKAIIIADWSPWPLLSQAYLVKPLMTIAKSPQEFILMLSGLPKEMAQGKTVAEAFRLAQRFDTSPDGQEPLLKKLLVDLANDSKISDIELQFLTTYFRPRINLKENLSPAGFGPFKELRHFNFALLNGFYARRYSPDYVPNVDSVFSSQSNFNYLKAMFENDNVLYALTLINDPNFYRTVSEEKRFKNLSNLTLSITNIFDCGGYNGLTFQDLQNYLKSVVSTFKKPLTLFRTTNFAPPHGFYRYEINSETDVPSKDEADSKALPGQIQQAG